MLIKSESERYVFKSAHALVPEVNKVSLCGCWRVESVMQVSSAIAIMKLLFFFNTLGKKERKKERNGRQAICFLFKIMTFGKKSRNGWLWCSSW